VSTSIGIAVYPNDGIDEEILLKNADIAMYQAKQAGRDRYQIYKEA
jgi:diguanylate cyclase (GGDEF)-like protein